MSDRINDTSAFGDLAAYQPEKYSMVDADSNCQSTVTTGGEDHLIQSTGGGDPQPDTGMSGGKSLL